MTSHSTRHIKTWLQISLLNQSCSIMQSSPNPRHPVIFSENDWDVPSPKRNAESSGSIFNHSPFRFRQEKTNVDPWKLASFWWVPSRVQSFQSLILRVYRQSTPIGFPIGDGKNQPFGGLKNPIEIEWRTTWITYDLYLWLIDLCFWWSTCVCRWSSGILRRYLKHMCQTIHTHKLRIHFLGYKLVSIYEVVRCDKSISPLLFPAPLGFCLVDACRSIRTGRKRFGRTTRAVTLAIILLQVLSV